jgi:hypothetical protein
VTLELPKSDKSKEVNDLHPENIYSIVLTEEVSKNDKSKEVNDEHPLNIYFI